MNIWYFGSPDLSELNHLSKNTIAETLGITFVEVGEDYLKATMPVDHRTHQPFGLLHGGASAVLAETLGSVGSYLCVDSEKRATVGLEINCNHIRSVKSGIVTGTAKPVHIGGKTQVWEIRIEDEMGKLICISRLTVAVLSK